MVIQLQQSSPPPPPPPPACQTGKCRRQAHDPENGYKVVCADRFSPLAGTEATLNWCGAQLVGKEAIYKRVSSAVVGVAVDAGYVREESDIVKRAFVK